MKSITLKTSHLIIAAVVFVAIGIGAYFVISGMNKPATDIGNGSTPLGGLGFKLDDSAKEYTGAEPENKSGDVPGIKIPGYGTVTLPANKTDVKLILLNPEGNPCYFTFELVVDGETYYTSNMVEPSKCIEDLTLTKPLQKGEYTAILKVRAWSLDESHTQMNSANVEFELKVV
ncbi:MAG: hypothetical protein FWG53_06345 [Clostridiales bacterium]|nr:hypothetical protein [Clostridiales bacterium]